MYAIFKEQKSYLYKLIFANLLYVERLVSLKIKQRRKPVSKSMILYCGFSDESELPYHISYPNVYLP
jgi:hypothetical protein